MAIFLLILRLILQALPLVIPAFVAGAKMSQSGEEGLASSAAGIPDGWANLLIWGCVAVYLIGQVSGWTLKGFFTWLRGTWASIVQSWKEAEPVPVPPVPPVPTPPVVAARTTYTAPSPVAPTPPTA